MTKELADEIISLYSQGWEPEDIAFELGVDETEVIEYCAGYDYNN